MKVLLGIDSGLTVTKAVLFDPSGAELASAAVRVPQRKPRPRWVERDMDELWDATAKTVRDVLAAVPGAEVMSVGVTAHGDGIYLVGEDGRPVRPGILSLDSRAHQILREWEETGVAERALQVTGQVPFVATPAALLAWLARHEPSSLARTAKALSCKDYIKLRLTGVASTDPTEASVSFTDVRTQRYSDEAFDVFGLGDYAQLVAPVVTSTQVAGTVTAEAASRTGLPAGTPVVSGLHDVDACALGTGCVKPGQLSMVAGTYSINQVISDRPLPSRDWNCRNFVEPGRWMNMSLSPASATNLEWFVDQLMLRDGDARDRRSCFEAVNAEVRDVLSERSGVLYLPFLFGSPLGPAASAAFLGIRGWHTRAHLLRAVFEGVVFNHRWHVDALRSATTVSSARLAGGAARSEVWAQMFADALNLEVGVGAANETGALGAAICAGIGCGLYQDLDDAVAATVTIARTYTPDSERSRRLEEDYARYREAVAAASSTWRDDV
jgi:L-xylulokinase